MSQQQQESISRRPRCLFTHPPSLSRVASFVVCANSSIIWFGVGLCSFFFFCLRPRKFSGTRADGCWPLVVQFFLQILTGNTLFDVFGKGRGGGSPSVHVHGPPITIILYVKCICPLWVTNEEPPSKRSLKSVYRDGT